MAEKGQVYSSGYGGGGGRLGGVAYKGRCADVLCTRAELFKIRAVRYRV